MSEIKDRMEDLLAAVEAPQGQVDESTVMEAVDAICDLLAKNDIEIVAEDISEFVEGLNEVVTDIPELREGVESLLEDFGVGHVLGIGAGMLVGKHLYGKFKRWQELRKGKKLKAKEASWRRRYEREKTRYKIHKYKSRAKSYVARRKQPYLTPKQRREQLVKKYGKATSPRKRPESIPSPAPGTGPKAQA